MTLSAHLKGSSAKWYLLGLATALAAGWIFRQPLPDDPPGGDSPFDSLNSEVSSEAIGLVRSGRRLERDGDSAGARAAYLEAAEKLPPIADYLRLRAAQVTRDSSARDVLYRAVRLSPAREQVSVMEPRIREGLGDLTGAARLRTELGQPAESFRLRLEAATGLPAQRRLLRELITWISDSTESPHRGSVSAVALPFIREIGAADLLRLARASSAASAPEFFARAQARGATLTTEDFAAWGEASYSRGRYREAAMQLRRVTAGATLPRSLLLQGRAMLRSGQRGGRAVLTELVRRFPRDSIATPTALFLLADLARDAKDFPTARQRWSELAQRFPASAEAPHARFLLGLALYSQDRRVEAAKVWDSLFLGGQGREEALAGGYWAGRAHHDLGDTATANARWRQVISRSRLSYYSRLSYRRLGLRDSTLVSGDDQFAGFRALERARHRLRLLSATGLSSELGMEANWLMAQAGNEPGTVVAIASLLRDYSRATSSAQLGWRALEAGAADSRTYRLIFPLLFRSRLVQSSLAERVEPALTAALIRQESLFDSTATSRAGARGLMQVMPAVGRELARTRRRTGWNADSLYQPGVNLELGTAHLAGAIKRYGHLERTLAAYNAGGSRVTRWARFPGSSDPEIFVEWVPFPETRTYVRTVLRNLEFYRGLYDWD
jgi:soluble lytic murein transglycosylase-like protein